MVLPRLLRELYVGRRTGLLHISRGDDRVNFRFVNGEVVSGSSTAEKGRLGETMVRYSLLSREDLDRALAIVNGQKRRLGPVLRELGVISTPRLEQALGLHIREMLLTTTAWDEAAHVFEDQELPELQTEDLTLRCATGELILELVRRITCRETVLAGLGDLDRPLVAVADPPFHMERITLTPADGYVLSRVNGTASARTLIEITPLPAEEVERSLLGLLCTGVIEPFAGSGAPPRRRPKVGSETVQMPVPVFRAPASDGRSQSRAARPAPPVSSQAPKPPVEPPSPLEALDTAERHLGAGRYQDAVAILEAVAPSAQGALERRARHLLARGYLMAPELARKAEAEYLMLIRLDPGDVDACLALGKFYKERSLHTRARALLRKVLDLEPGHKIAQAELDSLSDPGPPSSGLGKLWRRTG